MSAVIRTTQLAVISVLFNTCQCCKSKSTYHWMYIYPPESSLRRLSCIAVEKEDHSQLTSGSN